MLNKTPPSAISGETLAKMQRFFEPFNEMLYNALGLSSPLWTYPSSAFFADDNFLNFSMPLTLDDDYFKASLPDDRRVGDDADDGNLFAGGGDDNDNDFDEDDAAVVRDDAENDVWNSGHTFDDDDVKGSDDDRAVDDAAVDDADDIWLSYDDTNDKL